MSKLPWFRLYHRIIDDEKLRLLAFEDRWHFIAVLCLKADGLLDCERDEMWERKIAVKMGVQLRELDEIHRRLMQVSLINSDWQPFNWDALQFKTDNSTSRVQKWRKRQRKQNGNGVKRFSNVSVTAPDTDTDTELDTLEPKGSCETGVSPEHESDDDFSVSDFVESWNETADICGLPRIAKLTTARRRAFNVRKREYPDIEDWKKAFRCIRETKWMHGDNQNGWRADADFFLQAKSFTKLVEGAYAQADR